MKFVKRNIVILLILTFVCAAVYLNWSYGRDSEVLSVEQDADTAPKTDEKDAGLYYVPVSSGAVETDYFDAARLSRQQARDSAIDILQQTAATQAASQDAVDEAVAAISVMAEYSVSEAQIENLLLAKGFDDCLVFLSGDSATVTVPAPLEGLSRSEVSRITDIMLSETDYSMDQIKIIEIK